MRYSVATRLAWLGVAVVVIGLGVVALFVVGSLGLIGGGGTATPKGNFSVAKAQSFRGFPVYYPGESVNGYPLTAVARDPLGPMRKNQESVLFMYGTCKLPPGEGGCSLPVSVSNEPACSRNLGMYGGGFGSPVPIQPGFVERRARSSRAGADSSYRQGRRPSSSSPSRSEKRSPSRGAFEA